MSATIDLRAASSIAGHAERTADACARFRALCEGRVLPKVPGMTTPDRLALRLYYGRNEETAAAREYLYRWRLALASSQWGAPHLLGF